MFSTDTSGAVAVGAVVRVIVAGRGVVARGFAATIADAVAFADAFRGQGAGCVLAVTVVERGGGRVCDWSAETIVDRW